MKPLSAKPGPVGAGAWTVFGRALLCGVFLLAAGGAATAACKMPVSADTADNFTDHPKRYADHFPQGGPNFVNGIRTYVTVNRQTMKAVMELIRTANPQQKADIGRALSAAVVACLPRDGEVARQIADALKGTGDNKVIEAYLAASDDAAAPTATAADDDDDRSSSTLSYGPDSRLTIAPVQGSRLPATGNVLNPN